MSEKRTPAHKLCYRCGGWFSTLRPNPSTPLSEFDRHEAECLRIAQESDSRHERPPVEKPAPCDHSIIHVGCASCGWPLKSIP